MIESQRQRTTCVGRSARGWQMRAYHHEMISKRRCGMRQSQRPKSITSRIELKIRRSGENDYFGDHLSVSKLAHWRAEAELIANLPEKRQRSCDSVFSDSIGSNLFRFFAKHSSEFMRDSACVTTPNFEQQTRFRRVYGSEVEHDGERADFLYPNADRVSVALRGQFTLP